MAESLREDAECIPQQNNFILFLFGFAFSKALRVDLGRTNDSESQPTNMQWFRPELLDGRVLPQTEFDVLAVLPLQGPQNQFGGVVVDGPALGLLGGHVVDSVVGGAQVDLAEYFDTFHYWR